MKIIRVLVIILSVTVLMVSIYGLLNKVEYGKVEETRIFHIPKSLSGKNTVKEDENSNIYVANEEICAIQIFDAEGNFDYGVEFPTGGFGDFDYCIVGDEVHIFVTRTNMHIMCKNKEIIFAKTAEFDNINAVCTDSSIKNREYRLNLQNQLKVIDKNNCEVIKVLKLNAPVLPVSLFFYMFIMCISFIVVLISTGIVNKLQKIVAEK